MDSSKNLIISFVVEIPKGSSNKYEYDNQINKIKLDRVLYGANFYPGEYGFIEKTLDWDGDPLDVISLATFPTIPGCVVKAKVLGTIRMIDAGEIDTKLFAVFYDDPRFEHIKSLNDVPNHIKKEIENFFLQYKILQNKKVVINGWGSIKEAEKEINECRKRYEEYKDILNSKGIKEVKKIWKEKKLIK